MIVCLEGPSAVGKTTLAAALVDQYRMAVIPEANSLFARPAEESVTWYFECQVQRWQLALREERTHRYVVLDGDPFQPFWYDWAYNYTGWQPFDVTARFYREQIHAGRLRFPDLYCVLQTDETTLRERRASDRTRSRRGFEKHLQFVAPQRRYFEAMRQADPGRVTFTSAGEVVSTATQIMTWAEAASQKSGLFDSASLFRHMMTWLKDHRSAGPDTPISPP